MRHITVWILGALLIGLVPGAAPAAAQNQEAEAVYDRAQDALADNNFGQARELFRQVRDDYPHSSFAGEAVYWEAFVLYRIGGSEELREAQRLLRLQAKEYPKAVTREDARSLVARIEGELARMGDADAAKEVYRRAEDLSREEDAREKYERDATEAYADREDEEYAEQDDDDLRMHALNALLQMDADRAVPILRKILQKRDEESAELRAKAVFLLSQKHTEETEDLLLDVVQNDPDLEVRAQGVFWLSQVPSQKALGALEKILEDPSYPVELQDKAVFAISQHRSDRGAEILRNLAMDTRRDEEIRAQAIFWLSQSHSRENADFLWELYSRLDSTELKDKAIFALSQIDTQESAGRLLQIALDRDESMEIRKQALFWAGQQGRIDTDRLLELYRQGGDEEFRNQIIFVLSQRGDDEAAHALIQIARTETNPELKKNAVFWLGQIGSDEAIEYLEELINQ